MIGWFGTVEAIDDPEQQGRVRCRAFGHHMVTIATDQLPWASVVSPIWNTALNGVGHAPVGIAVGTTVFGLFLDEMKQEPIVLGTLASRTDLPQEALNNYPNNRVLKTAAGHLIEVDDTPDNNRIHVRHSKGTMINIASDGTVIVKSAKDIHLISNTATLTCENATVTAKDACNIKARTIQIEGDCNIPTLTVQLLKAKRIVR